MGDIQDLPEAGTDGDNSGNPAWNDFLEYVPEDKRENVTPLLQQWDRGVQDKIQSVRSEFDPWNDIIKSGYDPETTKFAQEVLSVLQNNPRQLYDALADNYGFTVEAGGDDEDYSEDQDEPGQEDPRVAQLLQEQSIMKQILLAQHQKELELKEEEDLDRDLAALKEKVGDFDEGDIMRRMYVDNSLTPEKAYEQQIAYHDQIRRSRPSPPRIAGGGSGAIPNNKMDVKKLSDRETRDFVVQTLMQARDQER